MDEHSSNKRRKWADLDDSFSSTEVDHELECPVEPQHPETEILLELLETKKFPLNIYLNNLPYDLENTAEILNFLRLPQTAKVRLIMDDFKPSGKAEVVASSREIAHSIVKRHGHTLFNRHIYMNLDSYFGRGKMYKKVLKLRENDNKHHAPKARQNGHKKQAQTAPRKSKRAPRQCS